MRTKDVWMLVAAVLGGYLGGKLVRQPVLATAATSQALRASSLELVDDNGKARAVIGMGRDGRQPGLRLFNDAGIEVASVSLLGNLPSLSFSGTDRKLRVVLELRPSQRPLLVMGDEDWQGRVALGAIDGDYINAASNPVSDWGLQFTGKGPSRVLAGIGMVGGATDKCRGTITVQGKSLAAP